MLLGSDLSLKSQVDKFLQKHVYSRKSLKDSINKYWRNNKKCLVWDQKKTLLSICLDLSVSNVIIPRVSVLNTESEISIHLVIIKFLLA